MIRKSSNKQNKSQVLLSAIVAVLALALLVVFFGPQKLEKKHEPEQLGPRNNQSPPSANLLPQPAEVNASEEDAPLAPPKMIIGSVENPPAELPEDLRQALQANKTNQDLPPEMAAQLKSPPPELPEDLRRQLENQNPTLPPDLQAQLDAPPPPIPDDIRQALQTPPRSVSIEEVNGRKP